MQFTTSHIGQALIKRNEGCVLHTYEDSVGVLTIGFGHTGPDVVPSMVITQAQADQMFSDRLAHEFEPFVNRAIEGCPTTQYQFDAMVSLTYNIGTGNFSKSSVLRLHKSRQYGLAASAFLMWDKAGGQVLAGLRRRRGEEMALYMRQDDVIPTILPQKQSQVQQSTWGWIKGIFK